jgi:hypothetical protein
VPIPKTLLNMIGSRPEFGGLHVGPSLRFRSSAPGREGKPLRPSGDHDRGLAQFGTPVPHGDDRVQDQPGRVLHRFHQAGERDPILDSGNAHNWVDL